MRWGRVVLGIAVFWAGGATAQLFSPTASQEAPWTAQPPQQAPWPSQPTAPAVAPSEPVGPAQTHACAEFANLRSGVVEHAAAAKAGSERHVQREELCRLISVLSAASTTWTKYTITKAKQCGIPAEAVAQIKGQDEHLAGLKKQICSGGAAGQKPTLMRIAHDPSTGGVQIDGAPPP
jgi:hypothetical protein